MGRRGQFEEIQQPRRLAFDDHRTDDPGLAEERAVDRGVGGVDVDDLADQQADFAAAQRENDDIAASRSRAWAGRR